jgi:8-oxo-dGTP diphosphatase
MCANLSSMIWRDGSGRSLADYPHPSVAVDVALLTVVAERLCVVVHARTDPAGTALPGTFVRIDETLRAAALRALREKVQVTGREPVQLRVFDAVDRDSRGRVLGVAHVDLVPVDLLPPGTTTIPAADARGLAFDHDAVVAAAVAWAQAGYAAAPDPAGLLGATFTLAELLALHQAVAGERLQKDTFRRHMHDALVETGESTRGTVGKPARLFRRR